MVPTSLGIRSKIPAKHFSNPPMTIETHSRQTFLHSIVEGLDTRTNQGHDSELAHSLQVAEMQLCGEASVGRVNLLWRETFRYRREWMAAKDPHVGQFLDEYPRVKIYPSLVSKAIQFYKGNHRSTTQ